MRTTARHLQDTPHLLYYGHYDVQPPDPIELWETAPFEPTIVEGPRGRRIVARGAVDDKGQLMTWLEAMRAWKAVHGSLPVRVSVFIEGEEESSSKSMVPFLEANREELKADLCVVSDTGMLAVDSPAITYMLRGIVYVEVTLEGPSHDLHSGLFGGAVVNPINELCRILADLHDADGRITIPGFYEDVARDRSGGGGFLADDRLRRAGLPCGRRARDRPRRGRAHPARAHLVAPHLRHQRHLGRLYRRGQQDGHRRPRLGQALLPARAGPGPGEGAGRPAALLRGAAARGLPDQHHRHGQGARPSGYRPKSPFLDAARAGIAEVFGKPPVLIGMGGSIPVVASLKKLLGLDCLLVGFGLDDDRVHSPNEKFELACYERGIKSHAAMLGAFATLRHP